MQPSDIASHGSGLVHPEAVLVARSGAVFTSNFRGGVAALAPDGSHHLITGHTADLPGGLRPNGIAFDQDGSFLLAHLGPEEGGVFRLTPEGQVSPVLREAEGMRLPPTNYAVRDMAGARSPLANVSSIAFAGPGRREAWLGCLLADRIMRVPMPLAGHPPPHWAWQDSTKEESP